MQMIKAVSGVAGASLVLDNNHPYIALFTLCVGAAANEYLIFYSRNEINEKL